MIPIKELDAICEPQTAGGVSVFGHAQVADTFLAWCNMSRQERRVLAGKMAAYDAAMADEFAQMIIDAVFPPSISTPKYADGTTLMATGSIDDVDYERLPASAQ